MSIFQLWTETFSCKTKNNKKVYILFADKTFETNKLNQTTANCKAFVLLYIQFVSSFFSDGRKTDSWGKVNLEQIWNGQIRTGDLEKDSELPGRRKTCANLTKLGKPHIKKFLYGISKWCVARILVALHNILNDYSPYNICSAIYWLILRHNVAQSIIIV